MATGRQRGQLRGHRGAVVSAFFPDGRTLISGSSDGTALIWDLTGRGAERRDRVAKLSAEQLETAWHELAGENAERAYRALWALAAAPGQSLPLLKDHLRPAPAADRERIARLREDEASGERLRTARMLELLERTAGPEARRLLEVLAKGAPGARLTREAKEALARLARQPVSRP